MEEPRPSGRTSSRFHIDKHSSWCKYCSWRVSVHRLHLYFQLCIEVPTIYAWHANDKEKLRLWLTVLMTLGHTLRVQGMVELIGWTTQQLLWMISNQLCYSCSRKKKQVFKLHVTVVLGSCVQGSISSSLQTTRIKKAKWEILSFQTHEEL